MGIHGSSTVSVILQDAEVPAENVLGELGKGHKIAFNTLNVGRWKLGAGCVGACKRLLNISARYVSERQQFGRPLASFELIKQKLADCAVRTYILESVIYRYAGALDDAHAKAKDAAEKTAQLEDFAVEASIAKVYGSEALDFVADEAVQMHGGYGYCEEYKVERFYRDNRINRIFEGTNEINRIVISTTLLKRAMAGTLDLMTELGNVLGALKAGFPKRDASVPMAEWCDACDQLKRLAVYVCGVAAQKYTDKIAEHQEALAGVSNIVMEAYAVDSGLARALQTKDRKHETMVKCYIAERLPQMKVMARQLLVNIACGDDREFAKYEKALDRIVPAIVFDTRKAKEEIWPKNT
jgi:hypothetical protein